MIQQALFTILSAHPGLSALVGSRIYPLILPQNPAYPALTYQRVSGPREQSHDGPSGLARPRFQVSCWHPDFDQAKAAAEQVRLALAGYRGIVGGLEIEGIQVENELDLYDPDAKVYRVILDFVIWHQEATT